MSVPLLLPLPGNEDMAERIVFGIKGELGSLEMRKFPDNETYVRVVSDVRDRSVALVCTLASPDEKFLPLVFAAAAV